MKFPTYIISGFMTFSLSSTACASEPNATPVDYDELASQVVAFYETHDVVALTESHSNFHDMRLRNALLNNRDFFETVDIILVEFGNAHLQGLLDNYIFGKDDHASRIEEVWRHTGTLAWETVPYRSFFETVRRLNFDRPEGNKIQVLAGDVPIPWDEIEHGRELLKFTDRGDFPTRLADCEVLKKGKKALFVYGRTHLYKNYAMSFVSPLARKYPGKIAVIDSLSFNRTHANKVAERMGYGTKSAVIPVTGSTVEHDDLLSLVYGQPLRSVEVGRAIDAFVYYGDVEREVARIPESTLQDEEFNEFRRTYRLRRSESDSHLREYGNNMMIEYSDYICD